MSETLQISRNTTLSNITTIPIFIKSATPSAQFSGISNKFGANVFTPLSLSTYGNPCIYWYDAQDSSTVIRDNRGVISSWNDKSGVGLNLTPQNPEDSGLITYSTDANNFRFMTGNGVLSYLQGSSTSLNFENTTFFIVYADSNIAGTNKFVFGAIPTDGETSEGSLSGFIFESENRGGEGDRNIFFYTGDNQGPPPTPPTPIINTFTTDIPLLLFQFNISPVGFGEFTVASFVNGVSSNTNNTGQPRTNLTQGISLGGFYTGTTIDSNTDIGSVYEIVGFSGSVNDEGREKMVGYFAWKYGQKPNIPQDSPYILVPPRGTTW